MTRIVAPFALLTAVFISYSTHAQNVTVRDLVTMAPLQGVVAEGQDSQVLRFTDPAGVVSIDGLGEAVTFYRMGYERETFSRSELEKMGWEVLLFEASFFMDEVVVSASRFEERKDDVAQQVQVLDEQKLRFINQQTSADVLAQSGNVLVQKSQQGGGSPIIRGFEANKVLIVVDGVRMNNAIYRGGHLQDVITLDNSMLDRVEVVFGPGSVVYGSDALGGVMHFYTRNPHLSDTQDQRTDAGAFARYSTANNEMTGHIDFNLGWKKWASLTSFTYSDFGDLRQGNIRSPFAEDFGLRPWYVDRIDGKDSVLVNENPNVQMGSGYRQYDMLQKFMYAPNKRSTHFLNLQYSTSSDVPRYDRLTLTSSNGNPRFAEWYYGPQDRLLASYQFRFTDSTAFFDHGRIIAHYQNIDQDRIQRSYRSDRRDYRMEDVDVYGVNADLSKQLGEHEVRYGIEAVRNEVRSSAYSEDIRTLDQSPRDTRYPDGGSSMNFLAAYVTHSWEINDELVLNDGIRVNHVTLDAAFVDRTFYPFPFENIAQSNTAVNGSAGLIWSPGREWRFSVLGSTGFRAPNVDDLAKVFESVPGRVVVPNPDLAPEHVYNADFGIEKTIAGDLNIKGTAFYTIYDNAITTGPGSFNGSSTIVYSGDTSQVVTSVNAGEAYIYGCSAQLTAEVSRNVDITSSVNYTYGRIRTDSTDYPLDHIPPVFGRTSLNVQLKKFRGEFFVVYNGWKRLDDYNMIGEDNFAYATPKGMPGWYTLNLRTAYQFSDHFSVQAALENIFDQNYRVFSSNISAPGRNFSITLRAKV